MTSPAGEPSRPVRCAIYTRKSTTEGLDTDFNTLDVELTRFRRQSRYAAAPAACCRS
jgi:hypothetical protein